MSGVLNLSFMDPPCWVTDTRNFLYKNACVYVFFLGDIIDFITPSKKSKIQKKTKDHLFKTYQCKKNMYIYIYIYIYMFLVHAL